MIGIKCLRLTLVKPRVAQPHPLAPYARRAHCRSALVVAAAVIVGRRRRRRPLLIRSPRLGILNLKGESAEPLITADVDALTPVLGSPLRGSTSAPFCDVLFIYCDVAADGRIGNFSGTLRDLIQTQRAPLVVVASENSGEAYISTTRGAEARSREPSDDVEIAQRTSVSNVLCPIVYRHEAWRIDASCLGETRTARSGQRAREIAIHHLRV